MIQASIQATAFGVLPMRAAALFEPDHGLLASLRDHERTTMVWLQVPGTAPVVVMLGDLLRRFPQDNAALNWAEDFLPFMRGEKEWTLNGGSAFASVRRPVDQQPKQQTPWGKADLATSFGPGVTFFSTPSHGGFKVERAPWLSSIPEAVRKETANDQGLHGWFEEDDDWCLVALAFPDIFDAPEVAKAWDQITGDGFRQGIDFWARTLRETQHAANADYAQRVIGKLNRRRAAVIAWNPPGTPRPIAAI